MENSNKTKDMLKNAITFFVFCLSLVPLAHADWRYIRSSDGVKGSLATLKSKSTGRPEVEYVSVKQFCFALGCKAIYQWNNHRVVIQNSTEHRGAIVSHLTHVALVDGKVISFDSDVQSSLHDGYMLPIDLASKLSQELLLGSIEYVEGTKAKPKSSAVVHNPKLYDPVQTVIIDPGHGGSDWGTGYSGIYEKDVAMIYAQKLRDELKSHMPDLDVVMTRSGDEFVSLSDRAKLANAKNANLFLSLHVNHAPNTSVQGAESYILSPEATDDDAKKVALLENENWLKTAKIKHDDDTVKKILVDMEQTSYIQDSALFASMVQQELAQLDRTRGLKNRGVKQAMFYVLSQVAMPSTLIEMSFLSNTGDRSRLMDVAFREEFVKGIVTALKRYREQLALKKETPTK